MSKISIALGTYNGAEFLGAQLESFRAQTRPPDELIVTDDCSTDETAKIVENFARSVAFPVKFQRNPRNLGSTRNFAEAIALCTGDLIFLSDQDDVWQPHKIEKIAAEFENNVSLGFIFSDADLVDENLAPLGVKLCDLTFNEKFRHLKTSRELLELLLPRNYITGATLAFRREYREFFLPFPLDIPEMIHDGWICLVIAAQAEFLFLEETLVKYRQHGRQQLGVIFSDEFGGNKFEQMTTALHVLRTERERIEKIKREFYRNEKLASQAAAVGELCDKYLARIAGRIAHYEARTNLPAPKIKRAAAVLRELKSGRYGKYSKGFLSAIKDFAADY